MAGRGPPGKASMMEGRREEQRGRVTPWAKALIQINSQVLLFTLAKDERKA